MEAEDFLHVIDKTPLVSIDIILTNESGEVLLGKRINKPAKDYWFVPGGRIRKNETLQTAMTRISTTELGVNVTLNDARLIGVFDHIYDDNFQSKAGINTHYVALGYEVTFPVDQKITFDEQHSEMYWWPLRELQESASVHENTKAYFSNEDNAIKQV